MEVDSNIELANEIWEARKIWNTRGRGNRFWGE